MRKQISKALEEELKERDEAGGQDDLGAEDPSVESLSSGGRGRPMIPVAWTRVVHVKQGMPSGVATYEIFSEQELQRHLRE